MTPSPPKPKIRFKSILLARCPSCHQGKVASSVFGIYPQCAKCGYNFYPEPGFYLGAMMVSFMLTAMLTIPPMVVLKLLGVDKVALLIFPFVEFAVVGTFLLFYSRVLWLHLEHAMTDRLNK